MTNYTLQDIFGCILGTLIFPLVLVFPGYALGHILNLFEFRKRLIFTRFLIGIVVSNAVVPILVFLEYRISSGVVVLSSLALLGVVWAFLLVQSLRSSQPLNPQIKRYQSIALLLGGIWILTATFYLVDIQIGDRLYFTVASHDLATRVSVVDAITRTGVPPVNPGYYPGHPVRLTFLYYFWYILASLVDQAGGAWVSAYQATMAGIIWGGISVVATLALYLRLRGPQSGGNAWRTPLLASQLFAVGGLDFIPVMILMIKSRVLYGATLLNGAVEGWNTPVMSWIHALTWVPNHVTGALACMTGSMVFLYAMNRDGRQQAVAAFIASLAFASAFGLSVWIMVTFGIFFALWMVSLALRKEYRRMVWWMALSGILALVFASPFIAGILQFGDAGTGGAPVEAYVRPFMLVHALLTDSPHWLQSFADLLLLPVNYLFELGFFLIVALLWLPRHSTTLRTNPFHFAEALLVVTVAVLLSFFRSIVIYVNDMGIRGWLLGQFILVVWAADLLTPAPANERDVPRILTRIKAFAAAQGMSGAISIFAVIGLLTSSMEISATRAWPMLVDMGVAGFPNNLSANTRLGARTLAARQAYDFVRARLPEDAVMQNNPIVFMDRPSGLYGSRQTAIADRTAYGVPPDTFSAAVEQIGKIFITRTAVNWTMIDEICGQYFIEAILVNETDPLWESLPRLEGQRPPLYKNGYYGLFTCGQ